MLHRALRLIRQYHNQSITELSVRFGIPKESIVQLESGALSPSSQILELYSEQFDIPVASLIFFSEAIGNQGRLSKKLRLSLAGKILSIMEWVSKKNEKC